MRTPDPAADQEDAALLGRIATGDRAAFAALWTRFAGPVAALAARYIGSAADGEDVAQETFLRIWDKAASYQPGRGAARAWIYTIARNTARDILRRQRLRWLVGLEPLSDRLADPAPGPADRAEGTSDLRAVGTALLDLPDAQRMALLLSAVAGLESRDIAAILGKSPAAVEQLIVRARRKLRTDREETDP